MALDLNAVEAVINRPHIIDLREDGWTLMHPPACHPNLFDCAMNRAATRDLKDAPAPANLGKFFCELRTTNGRLRIGDPAPDIEGVDWNALVAELRAAREVIEAGWAVDRKNPGCYGRLYRALQAHKTLTEGGGS